MELKDSIPFQLEFRRNYYQLQPRNLPNAKKEHLKKQRFPQTITSSDHQVNSPRQSKRTREHELLFVKESE